jgi:hypothetical protein
MGFKSIEEYNDDRYKNLFRLTDNGDTAQVIFLYQNKREMLMTNAHYIKSNEYSGYVHCLGTGCPACAKGVRIQAKKVFIPLYVVSCPNHPEYNGTIKFWDRTTNFEQQMDRAVFRNFPNASEFIFTIVRHGEPHDINTTYDIKAEYKNTHKSYDEICAQFNALFIPHTDEEATRTYYENICRSCTVEELSRYLSAGSASSSTLGDYVATPRAGFVSSIPDTYVDSGSLVTDNTPISTIPTSDDESNPPFPVSSDETSEDYPEPTF